MGNSKEKVFYSPSAVAGGGIFVFIILITPLFMV